MRPVDEIQAFNKTALGVNRTKDRLAEEDRSLV